MPLFRTMFLLISVTLFLSACSNGQSDHIITDETDNASRDQRPNIVYILVDDLGYADLGVFGSEIPTHNIDQLAREGMLLTDFHTSLTCSPTRSMLMSGTDNHLAGLGTMAPSGREDQRGNFGYLGEMNFRVASLANLLKDAGYDTYMTGKWHLGESKQTSPRARGFKRSFTSISGAAHLGGLSWNGPGLAPYRDGDTEANEIVHVGDDFYTTRFYTQRMIEYIDKDRAHGKPFFAYLAYTAPHWPLQAPPESIAKFKGQYDQGYEVLYRQRFKKMQALGFVPKDETLFDDSVWSQRWQQLTEEEKKYESRKMEIYAAMVSDLDRYVGEFIDYLKQIGELDNTFIIFSSDNGAEGLRRDLSEPIKSWVEKCCDNSYQNLGSGTSYIMYGPNWATASTVAHRRHKGTAFEGGINVPAFVWYPKMVAGGQVSDGFATVMDVLPTFLELAGAEHPGTSYQGREVFPVTGRSIIPQLTGKVQSVHQETEYTGWELYGHRGVRQGNWKIAWDAAQGDKALWLLFDLAKDPSEQRDLSDEYPQKLAEMMELWSRYAKSNNVIY